MLIDTHCHLLSSSYDDVNSVIENTFSNGIDKIIINGYDLETSKEAVMLSNNYENVYAAVGIGPESVESITKEDIEEIKRLASSKKVVAIGEIGLDYYWTKENKDLQICIFREMLEIAKNNNLPVIVHSREAIEDTYKLVKEYNVTGSMHCFSGSLESAREFIKLGFLIGIGGVVTFKNAKKIKEVVKEIDLSSIVIETDSPYLSPEPLRGKVNTPSNIPYIIEEIVRIKEASYDEVVDITSNNTIMKFDLIN